MTTKRSPKEPVGGDGKTNPSTELRTGSFIEDLIKARREIGIIKKDTKGFNYKYTKIEDLIKALEEPLFNHGFMVTQELVSKEDGCDYLRTSLLHVSDKKIESDVRIPQTTQQQNQRINELQSFGSAITYLRRYSLLALLFLATEDDDGSSFVGKKKDAPQPGPKYIGEPQIGFIRQALEGRNDIADKLRKVFKISSYGQIPLHGYEKVIAWITNELKKPQDVTYDKA